MLSHTRIYQVEGQVDYEGFSIIATFHTYREAKKLRDDLIAKEVHYDHVVVQPRFLFKNFEESLRYEDKKHHVRHILRLRRIIKENNQFVLNLPHNKELLIKYKDKI